MLEPRDALFSQAPPAPRTRDANNPTLLYSWWCTVFSAAIIIVRLCGRKTRSNKLFREDWIMMLAMVPLFIRMAFIHPVLLYGTNNVQTAGLTHTEIDNRSIGSRLVLAARIFYAAYIWTCKLTISEFLKRITIRIWRRSYELTLRGIRIFLVLTFVLVVIATLAECQPFDHYWQVVPDPGPHCRQGYGNLITMGTCDMITDIVLVIFPIPIIIRSGQTWRRKFQLGALFSLSLIPITITASRIPEVIESRGSQQYRTVWASSEILAATAVANIVIIGSFLRDKGTKRNRYRAASISDSIDRSSTRRPTVVALQSTGSEEDLFRFLGIRVPEHLQGPAEDAVRPAPAAIMASSRNKSSHNVSNSDVAQISEPGEDASSDSDSLHKKNIREAIIPSPAPSSRGGASFFDVGGLLEGGPGPPGAQVPTYEGTTAHDFAPPSPNQSRRGSRAFLHDVGGLLTPTSGGPDRLTARRSSDPHLHSSPRQRTAPTGVLGPMLERRETQQSLQDAGGLLDDIPESPTLAYRRTFSDTAGMLQRAAPQREESENSEGDSSFQDVGGLLSASHETDASAASLERIMGTQTRRRPAQLSPHPLPPPRLSPEWEPMEVEEPSDLLRK